MGINLAAPITVQKTMDEAWIKEIRIGGLPGGKYVAEVHLIPWNRETGAYEERVSLEQHPDMAFAVDVMERISSPKIKAAYDALVEAVAELHDEVKARIAGQGGGNG
jgi:hypothetical protein